MRKKRLQEQLHLFTVTGMPTVSEIRKALMNLPWGGLTSVARDCGIPINTLHGYKSGSREIPYNTALLIIEALRERDLLE